MQMLEANCGHGPGSGACGMDSTLRLKAPLHLHWHIRVCMLLRKLTLRSAFRSEAPLRRLLAAHINALVLHSIGSKD